MDTNQDGVLSADELARAGGRVVKTHTFEHNDETRLSLSNEAIPGSFAARPSYYGQPSNFRGFSPFGSTSFGPPAYLSQILNNLMSLFARPY